MMRTNYRVHAGPQFELLSWDQREEIYLAALKVLQRTGITVHGDQALDVLRKKGAQIDGTRACIPCFGRTKPGPSRAAGHRAIRPTRR
jgi:trimethylamine--corrinoid protein Co-methyltransferase